MVSGPNHKLTLKTNKTRPTCKYMKTMPKKRFLLLCSILFAVIFCLWKVCPMSLECPIILGKADMKGPITLWVTTPGGGRRSWSHSATGYSAAQILSKSLRPHSWPE